MTNPTPRDSAQLPPHFIEDHATVLTKKEAETYAAMYAREALRAQAASVEPVARVDYSQRGNISWLFGPQVPDGAHLYAGAPPAHIPADVEALVVRLNNWRSSGESEWAMGVNSGIDAAVQITQAWGRTTQPVAASSPATAVDATPRAEITFQDWWQRSGQFSRAGGGGYEETFAFNAWHAALQASRQPETRQAVAEGAGDELLAVCKAFISKHHISCAESIYQTDRIMEDATTFIEQVCDLVGYDPREGDDE